MGYIVLFLAKQIRDIFRVNDNESYRKNCITQPMMVRLYIV